MDAREQQGASRRGFVATLAGLLSGLFVARPSGLRAAVPAARQFIHDVELEVLAKARPRRDPAITWSTSGDRTTLYRDTGGKPNPVHTINPVGRVIWEVCDGRNTPRDMALIMERHYLVDSQRAYADCLAFLAELKRRGTIRL